MYGELNDYLAEHVNYPRWSREVYPLRSHAEELGRSRGMQAVRLDTFEENLPAVRLYEKCGFSYRGMVDLGLEEIYGLKWYKVFEKVL